MQRLQKAAIWNFEGKQITTTIILNLTGTISNTHGKDLKSFLTIKSVSHDNPNRLSVDGTTISILMVI